MFVHLDLGWMDHPFPWNRFKVRSEDEVRILRDLGLKTVRYCLKRSDTGPLDAAAPALGTDVAEAPPTVNAEMAAAIEEKRRRHEYLARYRAMMANSRKTLASAGAGGARHPWRPVRASGAKPAGGGQRWSMA
jgi:hypothetical protein